jgi:hypothetical protein
MADFSQAVTRPDGRICQIGDNDDGRFFKIQSEDPLCHRSLIESLKAFSAQAGGWQTLEAAWISDLIHKHSVAALSADPQHVKIHFADKMSLQKLADQGLFSADISNFLSLMMNSEKAVFPDSSTSQRQRFDIANTSGLQAFIWPEFGLVTWKTEQFFASFRCGPIGQKSRGGHDHNDQLSVEIFSNGQPVWEDPGTGIYTAFPAIRNRYRSAAAHHGPHVLNESGQLIEPGQMDQGLFSLNSGQCSVLLFANENCAIGYNDKLKTIRVIRFENQSMEIQDICLQPTWRLVPFSDSEKLKTSRGYGCF